MPHPQKRRNLFSENKKPGFGDMPHFTRRAVAPPKNAETFFPETRNPVLGTSNAPSGPICTDLPYIFKHGLNLLIIGFEIFRPYMLS